MSRPDLTFTVVWALIIKNWLLERTEPRSICWPAFCLKVSLQWIKLVSHTLTSVAKHQKVGSHALLSEFCRRTHNTRFVAVQCCFTSTETIKTIRNGELWTATSTFTQLLSSVLFVSEGMDFYNGHLSTSIFTFILRIHFYLCSFVFSIIVWLSNITERGVDSRWWFFY